MYFWGRRGEGDRDRIKKFHQLKFNQTEIRLKYIVIYIYEKYLVFVPFIDAMD